jgi:SpoVK/Ycf46/Vps4 family AAA+-type ATPase
MDYSFNSLTELIDSIQKYKGRVHRQVYHRLAKRLKHGELPPPPPLQSEIPYNYDMEQIVDTLEPLIKLNNLVGMEHIKKNIIDQILFYAQGLNTNEMMHTCLTGPPGVGKTSLGKILAEIYCSLGFLKTDKFKVVSRGDMIAGYIGQTALKTNKVLKESLGGVLFIDEAYSLGTGGDEDYSKECIDAINKFLSENTSNFIMIIAGYQDELDKYFFSHNKGLRRRFPWVYDIKGYSSNNLKDIFMYQVIENEWGFDDSFKESELSELFSDSTLFNDNGGDTLVLFDKAKICHSKRVFGKKRKFKKYLNMSDIKLAMGLLRLHKTGFKNKDPPFGMYC